MLYNQLITKLILLAGSQIILKNIKLLVWDSTLNKEMYELLESISLERGNFETYTILNLSEGETYIANGFITKTYK